MVAPLPESDTLKNKSENIHRGASPGTHYADSMLTKLAAEFAIEDRSQEKMKVTCGGFHPQKPSPSVSAILWGRGAGFKPRKPWLRTTWVPL